MANDPILALQVLVSEEDTQIHPRNIESSHDMACLSIPK
jgi:hypothetical protein